MKGQIRRIFKVFLSFALLLGAGQALAKVYTFPGSSDLCASLCGAVSGYTLIECRINFDGDTATGYICVYSN